MSTLKKVLLWIGGIILVLVVIGSTTVYVLARKARKESDRYTLDQRRQRKLHIGDPTQVVRLRAGVPDSVQKVSKPSRKETAWIYHLDGGDDPVAIVFDSVNTIDRIFTIGSFLWPPDDGLSPSDFSAVDATIQSFQDSLGTPCDTSFSDDSSWVRFYYRLSPNELQHDSVYKAAAEQGVVVLRMLQVDLRKGRKIYYHGWTRAGRSCGNGSAAK